MADISAAIRSLTASPGFSIVAVLTIAVAIAANTALFSAYDRLVLNPVTIPNASSLLAVLTSNPQFAVRVPAVSWPRYEEIRDQATSFASVGLSTFDNFTLTGNGEPQQLNGLRITPSFLPTLGIVPAQGRNFTAAEEAPNGPAVCIISHELWQTQFGGRGDLVGTTILLNGQPWEVVGIMPPRLTPPFAQTQVFSPRAFEIPALSTAPVQAGSGICAANRAAQARRVDRARPRSSRRSATRRTIGRRRGSTPTTPLKSSPSSNSSSADCNRPSTHW
jgi:hypothetical protein